MATQPIDPQRQELEDEYCTWAAICADKHGHPWPVSKEAVPSASSQDLVRELKKLKELGRTPHV